MCKKMTILALDVATLCGWFDGEFGGVWDLKLKRDESSGMRLRGFKAKLKEVIKINRPDLVVFERTAGKHVNALIVQAELHGVMKSLLDDEGIDYRAYSASEIKKHATGKGNCNKDAMIESCIKKLKIIPEDDNHADAIWLHHLAMEDYGEA